MRPLPQRCTRKMGHGHVEKCPMYCLNCQRDDSTKSLCCYCTDPAIRLHAMHPEVHASASEAVLSRRSSRQAKLGRDGNRPGRSTACARTCESGSCNEKRKEIETCKQRNACWRSPLLTPFRVDRPPRARDVRLPPSARGSLVEPIQSPIPHSRPSRLGEGRQETQV